MKTTVDVSCYWCHAKNRVGIGVDFYESKALYVCYSCDKASVVHLKQTILNGPLEHVQKGEPIT